MTKQLITLILALLFTTFALALDQKIELEAKHGGLIQKTKSAFLEVVQDKEHTSIYITGHDHKNITDKKLSISAIATVKGKKYPMQLSFENDHYSAKPANSYLHKENNYVLMITISFPSSKEKASFNLQSK